MGANDCTGIQDTVAADLYIVAQDGPHLFPSGGNLLCPLSDDHQSLVALDIGGNGPCPHVGMAAQDGVPHIVVMGGLDIVKEDDVF